MMMDDDASSPMMSVTDTDDDTDDDNGRTSSIFLRSTTQKALKGKNQIVPRGSRGLSLEADFPIFFPNPGTQRRQN